MKKHRFVLGSTALLLTAIVSCQKTEAPAVNDTSSVRKVYFVTDSDSTKTAIQADTAGRTATYIWEGTKDSYVHLFENGVEGSSAAIEINSSKTKATLSAEFSGYPVGEVVYTSVIAATYADGVATVPSLQHPTATSYDPEADILVGKSETYLVRHTESILQPSIAGSVKLKYARCNAVTRLVLTGMKAGEKIDLIKIECGAGINGPLKPFVNCEFQGYDSTACLKSVSLEFFDNNVVGEDGRFETYFTSWAAKPLSFNITVATDGGMYCKSADAHDYTLKLNSLNNICFDLEGQEVPQNRFELLTEAPQTWDGTYIIVNSSQTGPAKVLSATAKTKTAVGVTVKSFNGVRYVEFNDQTKGSAWDIADSGTEDAGVKLYDVKTRTDWQGTKLPYYLYYYKGVVVSLVNYTGLFNRKYFRHTFSYDEGGVQMTSRHDGDAAYMTWNGSAFEYNGDPSNRIFLYKYNETGRKTQILAYDNDCLDWVIADGKYEIGKTYDGQPFTSTSTYQSELLSYSSSDPSVASVDAEGRITVLKEGEVTITACAAATTEYMGACASYTIRLYVPHYRKVTTTDELTLDGKYLIVAHVDLGILGEWYHAFCASNPDSYNYDMHTVFTSCPVYDGGNKIEPSAEIDANQVMLERNLVASLTGRYNIKALSEGKYMYCNTEDVTESTIDIPFTSYGIAWTDSSSQLETISTLPHSITFDADGTVSIISGTDVGGLGGTLFFSKLSEKFSYAASSVIDKSYSGDILLYKYMD